MPKRIKPRKISKRDVGAYEYVRPNPGVRAIASINGRGAFSARRHMAGGRFTSRRARAARLLANITRRARVSQTGTIRMAKRGTRRRVVKRRSGLRKNAWREKKSRVTVRRRVAKRHSAAAKKGHRRKVLSNRKRVRSNKRRSSRTRKNGRRSIKRVKSNRRRTGKRTRKNGRRKSTRARKNGRRSSKARKNSRRRLFTNGRKRRSSKARKNGRRGFRGFRRNGIEAVKSAVKIGSWVTLGLIAQKLATGVIKNLLVSGEVAVVDTPATVVAESGAATSTSGILPASVAPYGAIISGALAAAAGVFVAGKVIKNSEDRKLVIGGLLASLLHTTLLTFLKRSPSTAKFADQISGLGSTATRLSAMYGVGASIQPFYSPIRGLGASPYEAAAGMGEYFGASGVGEYFGSGVDGLGSYGANPDVYQAAAGYGALETSNTNHILPGSDLDRELTIAEAAAGIGSAPMQAAAGMGEYFSGAAGLGNVGVLPSASTWIPGESNGQIWAGTRPVTEPQSFSAQVPAGILESGGGQGVFG